MKGMMVRYIPIYWNSLPGVVLVFPERMTLDDDDDADDFVWIWYAIAEWVH